MPRLTNCGGLADHSVSKGRSKYGALMIGVNIHLQGKVGFLGGLGFDK
jgi:hypothetical protein